MKIGIYVGSFNPLHNGHIGNVNYLLNNYLDRIYIIPTLNYWNKNNIIDLKYRLDMLQYIASEFIIIDNVNNGLRYTYQILEQYSKNFPNDELYLIIGADNIIDFDKWMNISDLLKYNIIVINRMNIDINYYINKHGFDKNRFIVPEYYSLDISSTNIRNNIDENREYLDSRVYKYIKENNLYGR